MTVKKIDLFNDWIDIISQELLSDNYNILGLTADEISIQYFSDKKKIIKSKIRQIKKSDSFTCPDYLIEGLKLIEKKIINGENLRPHQSRSFKRLNSKDGMLFDWGIYHLHLGTKIERDGFINRTGPLLYLLIDDNFAYLIDIQDHGKWSKQEFLKIIDENWPEIIELNKIQSNNIVGLEKNFNDQEIADLRKANINVLVEISPGNIVINPGGGIAASGDSMDAVRKHIDNKKELKKLEKTIIDNPEKFLIKVFKNGLDFVKNPDLEFKMTKQISVHQIDEINNNFTVYLNR
ncbi:MAG: hypothetical protein WDZ45_12195 [Flavobacteriaceae bacterium]